MHDIIPDPTHFLKPLEKDISVEIDGDGLPVLAILHQPDVLPEREILDAGNRSPGVSTILRALDSLEVEAPANDPPEIVLYLTQVEEGFAETTELQAEIRRSDYSGDPVPGSANQGVTVTDDSVDGIEQRGVGADFVM